MIKRFIHWVKESRRKKCKHCCVTCEYYERCKKED